MDGTGLFPNFGTLGLTLVAFVVALSIIVAVHEYGHYIVGKWTGIKADVFSIGFGPVLWSRKGRDGTVWQIAALPFGGYVKFRGDANAASVGSDGEDEGLSETERRETMHGAPLWARTLTVVAGPVFNFILSFIIFALLLGVRGVAVDPVTIAEVRGPAAQTTDLRAGDILLEINGQRVPPTTEFAALGDALPPSETLSYTVQRDGEVLTVDGPWLYPPLATSVTPASAAEDAGLQVGDLVVEVNDTPVYDFDAFRDVIRASEGMPVALRVERGDETLTLTMTPRRTDIPQADGSFETHYMIGMGGGLVFEPAARTPTLGEAVSHGLNQIVFITRSSISGLYHMAVGRISTCNMSGPIGIAETSGQAARLGLVEFIWFIAVLSTAVGMLNLFPIPVLDGGHLVFYAYEAVAGRPPSDTALRFLMAGGLTIMLALMLFAVGNDLFCP